MNSEQIAGIVRSLIAAFGGFAAAKGWISSDDLVALTGAGATIAATLWSIKSNSSKSLVTKADAVKDK